MMPTSRQHDARRQPGEVVKQQHWVKPAYRSRPRAGTVRSAILAALENGRSLTSAAAWREFGASRLAADVHVLRRMGWPILATDTAVRCREGRTATVAVYRLADNAGGRS